MKKHKFLPSLAIALIFTTLTACNIGGGRVGSDIPLDQNIPQPGPGLIPALEDPEGATRPTGGGAGLETVQEAAFDLATDLSMADIARHYAHQLSNAGWVLLEEIDQAEQIFVTWEVLDQDGNTWLGILEVQEKVGDPEAKFYVSIRIQLPPGQN